MRDIVARSLQRRSRTPEFRPKSRARQRTMRAPGRRYEPAGQRRNDHAHRSVHRVLIAPQAQESGRQLAKPGGGNSPALPEADRKIRSSTGKTTAWRNACPALTLNSATGRYAEPLPPPAVKEVAAPTPAGGKGSGSARVGAPGNQARKRVGWPAGISGADSNPQQAEPP